MNNKGQLDTSIPQVVCYTAVFSVVTQCSFPGEWGGALRDDTKSGCVADYTSSISHETFTNQAMGKLLATTNRKWVLNKT